MNLEQEAMIGTGVQALATRTTTRFRPSILVGDYGWARLSA
jgi:hypothetical protein